MVFDTKLVNCKNAFSDWDPRGGDTCAGHLGARTCFARHSGVFSVAKPLKKRTLFEIADFHNRLFILTLISKLLISEFFWKRFQYTSYKILTQNE